MNRFAVFSWVTVLGLAACSGGGDVASVFKPQVWHGVQIALESRPQPMRPGMNELLILATGPRGLPVADMVVSLRTNDQAPWRQGIQDGESGVFRRAVQMNPGDTKVYVRLQRGKSESTLVYPIQSLQSPSS